MVTKSKQYHLNYKVLSVGENSIPTIECDVNSIGTSLNIELASFIDKCGAPYTQEIIVDVVSLNTFTSVTNGYKIYSANKYNTVIPLQDFIAILNEWKAFLNSITFQHYLSYQ